MIILFTADWHIKLNQKNVPAEWAKNRYRELFRQIDEVQADLHIAGGDIFDRVPTLDELELYCEFVAGTKIPTIIYDGNHEATKKHQTFLDQLKGLTNKLNPQVEIITDTFEGEYFSILPYKDLHKKGSIEAIKNTDRPLFTHVRGEIPPHVKPEVDLDRFKGFSVVFAGDLHSHSNTQQNIVYPGSPVTTSFHRKEVDTGYIIIDLNEEKWSWHKFNLPQLIRKTVSDPKEMVKTEFHHTIYELEGDLQDLAVVENSELLDKKVLQKHTEAALILDPEMSINEELREYLLYILELPEEKVIDIMGVFNDYNAKALVE